MVHKYPWRWSFVSIVLIKREVESFCSNIGALEVLKKTGVRKLDIGKPEKEEERKKISSRFSSF